MFPVIRRFTFFVLFALFGSVFSNNQTCEEEESKIMVSIMDYNSRHICTGTILSDRWILSAAHCMEDPISVVVGYTSKTANTTKVFGVASSYVSEDFKESGFINDIGLLKLSSPIKMDESVELVKIPPKKITTSLKEFCNSTTAVAKTWKLHSDFDNPESLQCFDLPVIQTATCVAELKSAGRDVDPSKTICTESRGSDHVCNDDTGGPLMCNGFQIGVVSSALDCASPNIPGVFTRVDSYLGFINAALKQRGSAPIVGGRCWWGKDKKPSGYPYQNGHVDLRVPNEMLSTVVIVLASFQTLLPIIL